MIAMCLAAVMAMSVMSISVFAEESEQPKPVRSGEFPNGITYEIYKVDPNSPEPYSLSYWRQTVTVPLRNEAGTSGVILGGRNSFVPAPDNAYYVSVGTLPNTMPTVNVGLRLKDGGTYHYEALEANEAIIFNIPSSLIYDSWVATASTDELYSRSATFTCYTLSR